MTDALFDDNIFDDLLFDCIVDPGPSGPPLYFIGMDNTHAVRALYENWGMKKKRKKRLSDYIRGFPEDGE